MVNQISKAKEVFKALFYQTDEERAYTIINDISDPNELAFANIHLLTYLSNFQKYEKVIEILKEVEELNINIDSDYLQFWIDLSYCILYMGGVEPIIADEDKLNEKMNRLEDSINHLEFPTIWEEWLTKGMFENFKFWFQIKNELNPENAESLIKKAIKCFEKIPNDKGFFVNLGILNLANYYRLVGRFDKSKEIFLDLEGKFREYRNKWIFWIYTNLSWLELLNGEMKTAKKWTKKQLETAKRYEDTYGIYWSLDQLAVLLFQEKNYETSLKMYKESLLYRKEHNDPLVIFWGYFHLLNYHISLYQIQGMNESHLKEANVYLQKMNSFKEKYSNNKTMINYVKYSRALILRNGSIRNKAKSLDLLEELVEIYPNHIGMMVTLAESLFEDVSISYNKDTEQKIEELMKKIEQIPLRKNPQAITNYISQQILISKYYFYLKGNAKLALEILYEAKKIVSNYGIPLLIQLIENELSQFSMKYKKWEEFDQDFKERLKESEFQEYLQEALNMIKKGGSN